MHLADAFIQSNLHCIQAIHFFYQYVRSLGMNPRPFALLRNALPLSHRNLDKVEYDIRSQNEFSHICGLKVVLF